MAYGKSVVVYERPCRKPVRSIGLEEAHGCEIGYQTVDRHNAYSGAVEVRPFQAKNRTLVFLRRKGSQLKQ